MVAAAVRVAFCLCLLLVSAAQSAPGNASTAARILDTIFASYSKQQRPVNVADISQQQQQQGKSLEPPTKVDVNMKILSIQIDAVNAEFSVTMYLRQFWRDKRLSWENISQFESFRDPIGLSAMKELMWLPDLFFRNGKEGYLHTMTQPNFLIRVEPNGDILYSQRVTMKLLCQMQLQTFPMDTQTCIMNIGSYGHTTNNLQFRWKQSQDVEAVTLDATMQIVGFKTPDKVEVVDCTQRSANSIGSYACLKAAFKFERLLSSYLADTYMPSGLIVAVSWLNFWIGTEAVAARVTLGLLTLAGMLVQASNSVGSLPRVGYIKAIDVWIMVSITFVIAALLEFVAVSFRARRAKPVTGSAVTRLPPTGVADSTPEEPGGRPVVGWGGGGPDSRIDVFSRFVFPACFLLFNCCYWPWYLVLQARCCD